MLSSVPHAVDIINVRSSSLSEEQSKQVFLAISLRYYTYFSLVNHSQWIPYLTIRPQLRGHAMGKSCIIFLKTKKRFSKLIYNNVSSVLENSTELSQMGYTYMCDGK